MIQVGSNINSLKAQRQLAQHSGSLYGVYQRLASGQRINSASDDAAGLAISENLRFNTVVANQGLRNINDSISLINIADAAYDSMKSIMERQIELAQQASNGLFSSEQRAALNNEYTELTEEYNRILNTTKFNGISIFSDMEGSLSVQAGGNNLSVGLLEGQNTSYEVGTGTFSTLQYGTYFGGAQFLVADFNGNGFSDILVISANEMATGVQVFLSNGTSYTESDNFLFMDMSPTGTIAELQIEDLGNNTYGFSVVRDDASVYGWKFSISSSGEIEDSSPEDTYRASQGLVSATIDANGNNVADQAQIVGGNLTINIQNTETVFGFLATDLSHVGGSLLSVGSAQTALTELTDLRDTVSRSRGVSGASLSRLSAALAVTETARLESQSARERIISADIAADSALAVSLSIKQEIGAAVLSQANLQPSIALALLQPD